MHSSKLREYVDALGKGGRAQLARKAGVQWATIDAIVRGKTVPKPSTALSISRATGGAVPAAAILLGSCVDSDCDSHAETLAPAAAAGGAR